MKNILRPFIFVALAALAVVAVQAQPANDAFANAWLLTGAAVSTNGNSASPANATRESGEPQITGRNGGRSVWFRWTAPTNGPTRIDTVGSAFNTLLGVYTGTVVNNLTLVTQNDNFAGLDGGASQVEFNAVAGTTYRIAIDGRSNFGGGSASGLYNLRLQMLGAVVISAPLNGSAVLAGAPLTISADASVPSPPITRVNFYQAGNLFATDTEAPYSGVLNNPPLGTNRFFAVAVDSASQSWTSAVVSVAVLSVGVTIVSPADGDILLNANPIPVSAVGLLPSGSITNVEFFVDGQKFGEDPSAPFSATWNTVTPGAHRLTAVGADDTGATHTSLPVFVAVAQTLVSAGSLWQYLDDGTDQNTAWTAPLFNDESWKEGPAQLGYGDGDEATVVSFGPDPQNVYVTTYFRRTFLAPNAASYSSLWLNIQRDDGAVVYLNGVEAARFNMNPGPVLYNTYALNAGDDGAGFVSAVLSTSALVDGINVLAVEIHQATANSSDISFDLSLLGIPAILRNQFPLVALTSPTNFAGYLAPASLTLTATASDADGSVTNVTFRAYGFDGSEILLGHDTEAPFEATWTAPPEGWYNLVAIATDNEGAATTSQASFVTIYDAAGTPRIQLFQPLAGAVFEGPTNLALFAGSTSPGGVTNVDFLANGAFIGRVAFTNPTSPASVPFTWTNATYGTSALTAVSFDASGARGTSAPVVIVVNAPPPNLLAPTVASQSPAAGSSIGALTSIQVVFSERVVGVDAGDLRVNGAPASSVSGSGSNYTFTVVQPPAGAVNVTWAADHGIADLGFPPLPFDENGSGAAWTYNLTDLTPPTIAARNPVAGTTVTNLGQITVTFSEAVRGVDAADLLVGGLPALGLSGVGAIYTFSFSQPPSGVINVSWAVNHGIGDLASPPNFFNATGAGATWSYTLDARTILVQSNATWRFIKGTAEASTPIDAWRQAAFQDEGWSNALAPFYYGDPYGTVANPGTLLSDMQNGYSSIYLRKKFVVSNLSAVTNLFLNALSDDGFIAWINGVEVVRFNVPAGDLPYNGLATSAVNENNGVPYLIYTLSDPAAYLIEGTNELAVHGFNQSLTQSSDFGFNAQLFTFLADPSVAAPRLASVSPAAGSVFYLTNLTVRFTEPVGGVDAGDLLVNGVAATSLGSTTNTTYTFGFAQPLFGPVAITWAAGHAIADFDAPPKAFDGNAPGSALQYNLLNPSAPTVASQAPLAGATINQLTQLTITFSEPVTGVDAGDLLVHGASATALSGGPSTYTFGFAQPEYGAVFIGFAGGHGIADQEVPANAFDAARPGSSWSYMLVDQTAPAVVSQTPPAGALVTNLTQVTVVFSEAITGVNAGDLLVNGVPASGVSGSGAVYTFTFAQPNATIVTLTWANNHGLRDLAPVPNLFDATASGATWSYTTPDNVAPTLAGLNPPAGATVRALTQITVTFSETVTGVESNDLLINSRAAQQVSGSGAGPYTFRFASPSNGVVEIRWVAAHGISDLASPPNTFAGGEWTYTLDPTASFADKIVLNEIMFHPLGGHLTNEWVELHNTSAELVNLAGWRFSRGLNFAFPNVAIPGGGYLVVAADVAAFQAKYPGVSNVVGGWTGRLANSEETLELATVLGEVVDSVHYASQGDWARRERGRGPEIVTSLAFNGNNYTVTVFGHGYTGNDQVLISGANQPEYNGRFTINSIGSSTFNINVPGAPVSPATGTILCRHILDDGASGWSWFSAADGFGSSIELVNAVMPNTAGQNWLSSTNLHGTPGRANSVRATNAAPFLLEVAHAPSIPRSTDSVAITARVRDELTNGIASVTLFYRQHTAANPAAFSSTNLFDDGAHGDGVAADGLFGAVLPPAASGTVIEFYVQAADTSGLSRAWPAPAWETNTTTGQLANALYQVDNETITNSMPSIRVVLSGTERATYQGINRNSDAEMNVTMISTDGDGTKVRYLGGVRIRGAGSRSRTPPNNRVNIPNDNPWNGLTALNLNGQFVHAQVMGSAVARKSGLPASDARVLQYRMNGVNPAPLNAPANNTGNGAGYGTFVLVEPVNGDLAADLFPEDGDGNVYRASTGQHNADLTYQGANPSSYLGRGYMKTSNQSDNDWRDLMNLTFAFSQVANEADFVQAIRTNVNVGLWMRYFAVGSLVNFGETSLFNGRGDDYAMYRGVNDPRFVPIGHDFDTVFGQGDTTSYYPTLTNASIWTMLNPPNPNSNVPALRRFMTNAVFAPSFFAELKRLCDTVFDPSQLNPLFDQLLTGWGNGPTVTTIDSMKTHAAGRRASVLAQIPLTLTVSHALTTLNGFPVSTAPNVTLFGTSHAIDTRRVLVNGVPASWSAWEARWTHSTALHPGLNRVLVQSVNSNNVEFARATVDLWYDDGTVQAVSGALTTDTVWTAANGPHQVTAHLTVSAGVTLTIQPGTTVYLSPGVDLIVANGGRLLAEGTDAAGIRLASAPGAGNWGGLTVNGGPGSPETRLAFVHVDGNNDTAIAVVDGTAFLDHLTFGNPTRRYLDVDRASFVVQNCVFPATSGSFEPVHGAGGIKAGGRGIFQRNFWGKVTGYNDALDFTGGNRPGPILQVLNNVFMGSDDDLLDLDSTDAWVEGNIFLHTHRNGSPDSASAISGGADNADTSQITAVGNLFFDVDQAALAKQGNFYTLINNTIVHQNRIGSQDTNTAVVILADEGTAQGAGMYLEGNLIVDAENLTRHVTTALVTYTNNLIHQLAGGSWSGPGGGNVNVDPLLKRIPPFSETTNFTSWAAAQVMWDYFSLRSGSPARGAGPNGRDLGGVIPRGVSISGEPVGTTPFNTAVLRVDFNRTGHGIPTAGFPNGSGYTHYRWRLDGGAWSAETPLASPISLSGLSSGPHTVEVTGRRDAGFYQDDAVFGPDAVVTTSRTWTVNPGASPLRLSEILAANSGALVHSGTTPDAIELHNASDSALDLQGVRLTDDPANPDQFLFPAGASIPARGYLTVFANQPDGTPGFHLGFGLSQGGDALYLYDAADNGGALLDAVVFGLQLPDRSIGRLADGAWALTEPTFGAANRAAPLGDPARLRLNEWLALGSDFIELYNPEARPVALGGLFLSDELIGRPLRHEIPALSFVPGFGYQRFLADGDAGAGAEHVNFTLSGDQGELGLFAPGGSVIDCVYYQAQRLNVAQGRSPNGGGAIVFLDTPTPGAPNPVGTVHPLGGALVINEVLANNASLAEAGRTPDWIELYNGMTNDVALGDLSLTDDSLLPRRWVFPAGMVLETGDYFRVRCDAGLPASLTPSVSPNSGFGLKSSGGGVYLFDAAANGGGLLSAVSYGVQAADLSIGRVPSGSGPWVLNNPTPNAANSAVASLGEIANLRVNEWLADPPAGEDDWIELYNPNPLPVALGDLHLSDDLNNRTKHRIAPLSFLGTGTNAWLRFVADGNPGAGADHVGFSLRAAGEAVGISTTGGVLIDGLAFGPQLAGVSEGRFPDGATNVVPFPGTGSPGASNWRWLGEIAVNEVLTHTDPPLEDAIELRNLTGQAVDVGGWWLSDDGGTLQKYQIPSPTVLAPHGFAVIYESVFTNRDQAAIPFALSSGGDEVVLSAAAGGALTGFRTRVSFGAQDNGVAFGRHLTSDGRAEFVALSARTFGVDDPSSLEEFRTGTGASNASPRVGPVVISEIMYHPPAAGTNDNVADEFIELHNISTAPVALHDPAHPTNTWRLRDAVDFDFPSGTVLAPGEYLLVVSFDPVNNPAARATFRSQYNIPASTALVGPYIGKLANDTDDLELRRPGDAGTNGTDYILVERVRYFDTAPWPVEADGTGLSLQRADPTLFGNDPAHWLAASPTPGPQAGSPDSDGDGQPDAWETLHGLDPFHGGDAPLDFDFDGLSNLQEYQAGTDPRDALSVLRFAAIATGAGGEGVQLTFQAVSNQTYSVLWKESFEAGQWTKLADVAASPASGAATVLDPLPPALGRLYRLVTPQQPGPVTPLPAVLSSPDFEVTDVGGEASFRVIAVGDGPLSYQWRAHGSVMAGVWGASLVLTNVQFSDMGLYSVTVSDANRAQTSGEVYLAVRPRILSQPQGQSVPAGGTVVLSVTAEGVEPLIYRWYHGRRFITGQTGATLVLTNVQAADAGSYFVTVTHQLPWGRFGVGSAKVVVSVEEEP